MQATARSHERNSSGYWLTKLRNLVTEVLALGGLAAGLVSGLIFLTMILPPGSH